MRLRSLLVHLALISFTLAAVAAERPAIGERRLNSNWEVTLTNEHGVVVRVLSVPPDDLSNALMRSGWRNDHVVWVDAHVSPWNGMYHEWDAQSGRLLRSFPESKVEVSPDGKHVAWLDVDGLPAYENNVPIALAIDDGEHVIDVGGRVDAITWSPDGGELAVAVRDHGAAANIVILNATTRHVARTIPTSDRDAVRELQWDAEGIQVRTAHTTRLVRAVTAD